MPTTQSYRRRTSKLLGFYFQDTADASGNTTTIVQSSNFFMKSSIARAALLRNKYILRPAPVASGDRVRFIKSYDPTNGQVTVDLAYTNNAASAAIEIHGVIEPWTDMNDILNEALDRIPLTIEFTFTPATNTATRHSLASAAAWLDNPLDVYQVGYLSTGETRADTDPFKRRVRGEAYADGATVYLTGFTLKTTDTVYVLARKNAYDHCRASGGTYGDQSGLSANTDEAVPDDEWVATAALVEAWDRFGQAMKNTQSQRENSPLKDRAQAADRFSILSDQLWIEPERTFRKAPIAFGPRW